MALLSPRERLPLLSLSHLYSEETEGGSEHSQHRGAGRAEGENYHRHPAASNFLPFLHSMPENWLSGCLATSPPQVLLGAIQEARTFPCSLTSKAGKAIHPRGIRRAAALHGVARERPMGSRLHPIHEGLFNLPGQPGPLAHPTSVPGPSSLHTRRGPSRSRARLACRLST
jgi:hypothetical protein